MNKFIIFIIVIIFLYFIYTCFKNKEKFTESSYDIKLSTDYNSSSNANVINSLKVNNIDILAEQNTKIKEILDELDLLKNKNKEILTELDTLKNKNKIVEGFAATTPLDDLAAINTLAQIAKDMNSTSGFTFPSNAEVKGELRAKSVTAGSFGTTGNIWCSGTMLAGSNQDIDVVARLLALETKTSTLETKTSTLETKTSTLETKTSTLETKCTNISFDSEGTHVLGDLIIDSGHCCVTSEWHMFKFGKKERGIGIRDNFKGEYPFFFNAGIYGGAIQLE